jgi:DNA-binding transcriptional MocR family regulator
MEPLNRGITQSSLPEGVIDLGLGHPNDALLPHAQLAQAAAHRYAVGDPSFLQYGAEAGSGPLREALAAFLQQATGVGTAPSSLFISNGVSQALDLICTLFTRPGDCVVVEEPTYFLALRIFADHGLVPAAAPTDANGLVVEWLEEELRSGLRPALVYTVPTHQNPSGVTLSAARRAALVELSRRFAFRIVADEVYHLLTFEGAPPPPLAAWADEPTVISLGSFSKILAPGLRLGWLQAAPEAIAALSGCGLLDSGGGLNPHTGAVVQSVLELGLLAPNVAHLNATYRARRDLLAAALQRELPQAHFAVPAGGYFLWASLGEGVDAGEVAARAERHGVGLRAGERFAPERSAGAPQRHNPRLSSMARLCFAYYDAADLEEGVRRLASAVSG